MLADRVSQAMSKGFRIPPPPTIAARVLGASQIAFSHFKSDAVKPGLSTPSVREEAFVFNIPLIPAKYSVVSIDGRRQSVVQSPGEAYLFDLTSRNEVSLDAIYDSVRIHLTQTVIDDMAYEKGFPRIGGLYAKSLGQRDETLHHLALAILPAIQNPHQVTTAFVEYMALAIHDHVIRRYAGSPTSATESSGLSLWQIRRANDFINANLSGDPSIAAMSQDCGLSASYFAKAFRISFGMTPHKWILKKRIERAKSLMALSGDSLGQIAVLCGFFDQSHFCRYFARHEGLSPAQWRRLQGSHRG